jgi:hypothetical protein
LRRPDGAQNPAQKVPFTIRCGAQPQSVITSKSNQPLETSWRPSSRRFTGSAICVGPGASARVASDRLRPVANLDLRGILALVAAQLARADGLHDRFM